MRFDIWVGGGKDVRVHLKWKEFFLFSTGRRKLTGKYNVHEAKFLFERVVEVKLQSSLTKSPSCKTISQFTTQAVKRYYRPRSGKYFLSYL